MLGKIKNWFQKEEWTEEESEPEHNRFYDYKKRVHENAVNKMKEIKEND